MEELIMQIDGGSRGNPGPSAAAFWIPSREVGGSVFIERATNNYCEYQGLILALRYALANNHLDIKIQSDSKLIVNQVNGVWATKSSSMQELKDIVDTLIDGLESFEIEYIPRELNVEADRLCNVEMDAAANSDPTGFWS